MGDFPNASVTCLIYDQYFGLYASGWFTMADGIPCGITSPAGTVCSGRRSATESAALFTHRSTSERSGRCGTTSQYATGVPIWNGTSWTTISLSSPQFGEIIHRSSEWEFVVGGNLGSGNVLRRRASPPAWVTIGSPGFGQDGAVARDSCQRRVDRRRRFRHRRRQASAGIARYTFSPQPRPSHSSPPTQAPCRGDAVLHRGVQRHNREPDRMVPQRAGD